MPEITFVPYIEGEVYDASSLNTRFTAVKTGLEGITPDGLGPAALGSEHVPALAGYTEKATTPQTPHLVSIEGTTYTHFNHTSNQHLPTVNLAENPVRWPSGGGGGGNAYGSNPGSWIPIQVGSTPTPLEVYFEDSTTLYPIHLKRAAALAESKPWAQGLVVMLNVHFHKLIRDTSTTIKSESRLYAAFCIQVFVGDTIEAGSWYIIKRSIRFLSEKILPTYKTATLGIPYASEYAKIESWIDVPLRTVIRREDLIDFGFADNATMPPVLGVRACVGKWEVRAGPVQIGSYAGTAPSGQPIASSSAKIAIRQGNMTIFPMHAAAGVTTFVK
jgi:hypothetical protein